MAVTSAISTLGDKLPLSSRSTPTAYRRQITIKELPMTLTMIGESIEQGELTDHAHCVPSALSRWFADYTS